MARGMSSYIDALTNYTMRNAFLSVSPNWEVDFLSKYPDFFSFVVVMLLAGDFAIYLERCGNGLSDRFLPTVLLAVGVKESTLMNNIFTALNLLTIAIVIIAGGFKGEFSTGSSKNACN